MSCVIALQLKTIETQIRFAASAGAKDVIRIDEDSAARALFSLSDTLADRPDEAKAELRNYLKCIELEPVENDGKRFLQAKAWPQFAAILPMIGSSSKECNGGGRI
jgi:hypothetical protein